MLKNVTQIVYPKDVACIVCGKELPVHTRYGVCNECRPSGIDAYCHICGTAIRGPKKYCDSCLYSNRVFDRARAPFCFEDEKIRKLIYGLKYGDKTYLAEYMAQFMVDTFYRQGWEPDLVTYVPIHKRKRIFIRGYDQSKLIAKQVSELLKLPLAETLTKIKYTRKSAAKFGRADRKRLLENTFEVNCDVRGKKILLIDDVFTSGATTEECAKVLRRAKAKNIWVLTFATSREKLPLYSIEQGEKELDKFIKKNRKR